MSELGDGRTCISPAGLGALDIKVQKYKAIADMFINVMLILEQGRSSIHK